MQKGSERKHHYGTNHHCGESIETPLDSCEFNFRKNEGASLFFAAYTGQRRRSLFIRVGLALAIYKFLDPFFRGISVSHTGGDFESPVGVSP